MYDVTALGELLIDFASLHTDADGYPTMAAKPGGAPANYLAALSVYGMRTAMLSKVGADAFGTLILRTMGEAGIETKGIVVDSTVFTTLAFVTFSQGGERSFSFARKPGADTCLRYEELDLPLIDQAHVFHFGTLSLTDEPARTATQRALAYAKDLQKLITFDPNLRAPLWESLEQAKEQMLWGMKQADIVKVSDEEVDFLWGCGEREAANMLLDEYGVSLAMITLGSKGSYLQNKHGGVYAACPAVKPIDTTGAGDIFGGAAVSRILKIGKHPSALNEEELRSIACFASAAASLSTQKMGGIPSIPSEEEVNEVLRSCLK